MYTVRAFHVSQEVAVLGISLYVLGFALGPLIFAPLGEVSLSIVSTPLRMLPARTDVWKGKLFVSKYSPWVPNCQRIVFLVTLSFYVPLNLGGALAPNVSILLAIRLLTGICGSSRALSSNFIRLSQD